VRSRPHRHMVAGRDIEHGGERNRGLYVLKSRGNAHSNQIASSRCPTRASSCATLCRPGRRADGSARLSQEAQERSGQLRRDQENPAQADRAGSKRAAMEAQIVAIRAEFAALEAAALAVIGQAEVSEVRLSQDRHEMAHSRRAEQT